MIEFEDEGGGRYLFTDDIINLQNLALSITEIFDGCDNFIISGCDVSSSAIGEGYVFIDGKIRYFEGASVSSWPQYIYASDSTANVDYANDGSGLGRTTYAATSSKSKPSSGSYISVSKDGSTTTIKDAFFKKYAVTLDTEDAQTVSSDLTVSGSISTTNVTASGYGKIGDIKITGQHIYLDGDEETSTLYINQYGYDGGTDYCRNLRIGDGKGNTIVRTNLDSDVPAINAYCALNLWSNAFYALRLYDSEHGYDDDELSQMVVFGDSNGYTTGRVGFGSTSDNSFYIENWLGNVQITAYNKEYDDDGDTSNGDNSDYYVNISPAIKENGTLLSEKYQLAVSDSGWTAVYTSGGYSVYMRKIGSIVCLQGSLYINSTTMPAGTSITFDGLKAPGYAVAYHFDSGSYAITVTLAANSTEPYILMQEMPDSTYFAFPFSMTYMTAE